MSAAVWAGAVAVLLALGSAPLAGPDGVSVSAGSRVTVTMTTENDEHDVSLLDPAHPGYAIAGIGSFATVHVTVHLNGTLVHQWLSHLDAPDALQPTAIPDCRGEEEVPPAEVSCDFVVSVKPGANLLAFRFSADDDNVAVLATGSLVGGAVSWSAGWEVLDATGRWSAVSRDRSVDLPATLSSALRYVVTNTGDLPFRLTDGCSARLIAPHTQLVCPVSGVRPAQSLAGQYERVLHLRDTGGGRDLIQLDTSIRSFSGVFTLEKPSVIVGQLVVVHADGLPRGSSFAMEFRLDDEPVLVGTKVARSGTSRLEFPLPSTSQGTAHLQIEHDGVAIASLPFDVTLVPQKPDAAPPSWPWLFLLLVPLGGLGVLLLLGRLPFGRPRFGRLRRTPISSAGPRASRPPGPYPDATPATPEPVAAHRP
jgi:hypothetical protein